MTTPYPLPTMQMTTADFERLPVWTGPSYNYPNGTLWRIADARETVMLYDRGFGDVDFKRYQVELDPIVLNGLPTQRMIIPPPDGWKPHTLYLIEASMRQGNPVHQSYLMVGFLDDKGSPGAYTEIWNNTYERVPKFSEAYYLKVVRELHTKDRP